MAYNSLRTGGPVIRIDRQAPEAMGTADEVSAAALEIMPVIDALEAVGSDLEHDKLDAAWVELDNAELELRCQDSRSLSPQPALGKALNAVGRARDSMAVAEVDRASADIAQAIQALRRI